MYFIIWHRILGHTSCDRAFVSHIECDSSDEALNIWCDKVRSLSNAELCLELGIFATNAEEEAIDTSKHQQPKRNSAS